MLGRIHGSRPFVSSVVVGLASLFLLGGCGRSPIVSADGLPLRRVVVYRNGVAYFERAGHVEGGEVRFRMKESEVGDFLATLSVMEKGGSSVRSAAFPLKPEPEPDVDGKKKKPEPPKSKLKQVILALDGKAHDLEVGYVAESPVWRPSYRLLVDKGDAYLQAWGIVQNLSGEDWKNVRLSLVAGAPLAFEAQLGESVVPQRPIVSDQGEVIAAVPKGDTSLDQRADRDHDGIVDSKDVYDDVSEASDEASLSDPNTGGKRAEKADAQLKPMKKSRPLAEKPKAPPAATRAAGPGGGVRPLSQPSPEAVVAPRNLRSLAAVAVESGSTRYDLPEAITVPDRSATMVMLLSQRVPGEALFLFAPDGGVPDSTSHPFRVARFTNKTAGVLERGPIAVFEKGSFLGQGMVDPLPAGATATVPFALERAIAVTSEHKYDERGERVAKIENGELTIERDTVHLTKYRLQNGNAAVAKLLVRHPRTTGARLETPPAGTEDNVGSGTALVPALLKGKQSTELVVDERTSVRRREDWFSVVADAAVKSYSMDARADKAVVAKLQTAWTVRKEIVDRAEIRGRLAQEQANLGRQTEETRANLRAIEKNKTAEQLRVKLTQRLAETSTRLDEAQKRIVEIDSKLAELRIQFKEVLRDVKVVDAPAPVAR